MKLIVGAFNNEKAPMDTVITSRSFCASSEQQAGLGWAGLGWAGGLQRKCVVRNKERKWRDHTAIQQRYRRPASTADTKHDGPLLQLHAAFLQTIETGYI